MQNFFKFLKHLFTIKTNKKKQRQRKEQVKNFGEKWTSLFKRETLSVPVDIMDLEVQSRCCFFPICEGLDGGLCYGSERVVNTDKESSVSIFVVDL